MQTAQGLAGLANDYIKLQSLHGNKGDQCFGPQLVKNFAGSSFQRNEAPLEIGALLRFQELQKILRVEPEWLLPDKTGVVSRADVGERKRSARSFAQTTAALFTNT